MCLRTESTQSWSIKDQSWAIETVKDAGGYKIGDGSGFIILRMTKKPNFIHRFFMKLLLGITWVEQSL